MLENYTCLAVVGRLPSGFQQREICDFHARVLYEVDMTVAGLLMVHPGSFIGLIESSPEGVAALLRQLYSTYGSSIPMRVIGFTEDVPLKRFGPWSFSSITVPPELGVDLSTEPDVTGLCASIYRTLIQLGRELKQSAPAVS